jgi:hypothetical protein
MTQPTATRRMVRHESRIHAPPERVFPLLCPIREYDWIDGWRCNLLHSDSGLAERGAVFTSDFRPEGSAIWIVSRYDPATAIEFVVVFPGSHVMTLEISLTAVEGDETRILWACAYTSLVEPNPFVAGIDQQWFDRRQEFFDRALDHYCTTGTMLRR